MYMYRQRLIQDFSAGRGNRNGRYSSIDDIPFSYLILTMEIFSFLGGGGGGGHTPDPPVYHVLCIQICTCLKC